MLQNANKQIRMLNIFTRTNTDRYLYMHLKILKEWTLDFKEDKKDRYSRHLYRGC